MPSTSGLTGGTQRAPVGNVVDYDSNLAASGTIGYGGPIGIDPDDHRSGNRESDYLTIGRASTYSTAQISGDIRVGNSSATLAASTDVNLSASPSSGMSCTVAAPVAGVATYTCTVDSTYNGTLSGSTGATGGFFDVGGDITYDTESTTVPENSCGITSGTISTAWGVNNHMGSKATENPQVMKALMEVLKKEGLYYVNSHTSSHSVGPKIARREGVAFGSNDRFIDQEKDLEAIKKAIRLAMRERNRRERP